MASSDTPVSNPELPHAEESAMITNRSCVLRLSRYKNALYRLQAMGFVKVFSDNVADAVGVTSSRVRKDFSLFGITGNRKGGYFVADLISRIEEILGTHEYQSVVVMGAGKIGRALMEYNGFERERLKVVAGFDIDPHKIDTEAGVPVLSVSALKEYVERYKVRLGIIAVPEVAAEQALRMLTEAGVVGILNFAPVRLTVPESVTITNVNLALELENLAYFVNARARGMV